MPPPRDKDPSGAVSRALTWLESRHGRAVREAIDDALFEDLDDDDFEDFEDLDDGASTAMMVRSAAPRASPARATANISGGRQETDFFVRHAHVASVR